MTNFLIIDTESAWDEHLHEAYRAVEPGAQPHRRLASKRIFAAAALDLTLSDDGIVTVNGLASWTERDHGDDAAIAAALFDHIRFRPDHQVVTWSGLAAEVPLLTLTAMQAGLPLPPQLRAEQRFARGCQRPHRDLALEMKGQGRDWAHLSEILLRLGAPTALVAGKARVDLPTTGEQWIATQAHVELDTGMTAMALLAWLSVQGTPGISIEAMIAHLASWFLRNRPCSEQQQEVLEAFCAEMMARIAMEVTEADSTRELAAAA
jgi:hypothetical protein